MKKATGHPFEKPPLTAGQECLQKRSLAENQALVDKLIQKGRTSQVQMQKLRRKREFEVMKELQDKPEISKTSAHLAQRVVNRKISYVVNRGKSTGENEVLQGSSEENLAVAITKIKSYRRLVKRTEKRAAGKPTVEPPQSDPNPVPSAVELRKAQVYKELFENRKRANI